MPSYCFDTEPAKDFAALCERMAGKPLQSPYRSTVPLLSLVEHSQSAWRSLLTSLGEPPNSTIHFEYCVPSPKAGANPSQTDALIMSEGRVWGIEAKWTEPRYETVARRMRKPKKLGSNPPEAIDEESREIVEGWLAYLQPYASRELRVGDFEDAVYQMVHRAASACAVASGKELQPELTYLHFHPSPLASTATTDQYVSDLRHLRMLLGPGSALGITVVEMPLEPTAAFRAIEGLDKRARETADAVSAALQRGPLFEFGPPVLTAVP